MSLKKVTTVLILGIALSGSLAHAQGKKTLRPPLELSIPMPIGESATGVKIPDRDAMGALVSQLAALKVTRLDEEHFQMQELVIHCYQPDGQEEYRIELPECIFNPRTRMITSKQKVKITGANFELTGERLQFDTGERSGRLLGKVHLKMKNTNPEPTQSQPSKSTP